MFLLRLFDLIISSTLLIILFPLIFLISIAILIFNGLPIFFLSQRIGLNRKTFLIFKFRTMKNLKKKISNDKRLTKLGIFLRRTSLDELPQLFNVIIGNMSIVGPRPIPLKIEEKINSKQKKILRSKVKPGITGLSQINYSGKKRKLDKKLSYDISYVRNYSVYNYFIIIFKTFSVLIKRYKNNTKGKSL